MLIGGGKLPARFVIHTVGPIWRGGDEGEETILRAWLCQFTGAGYAHSLRSCITFPSVSTGAYRFPLPLAARIAQETVLEDIGRDDHLDVRVGFVLFDEATFAAYRDALRLLRPQSDKTR